MTYCAVLGHYANGASLTMPHQIYNWKRFWCSRTGYLNLSSDGYLSDPDSEWGHIYNPDVVPFESITGIPCLALLGEPGMGKSTAMRSQRELIDQQVANTGGTTLWINLGEFQTEVRPPCR